jgi:hypothetical protein
MAEPCSIMRGDNAGIHCNKKLGAIKQYVHADNADNFFNGFLKMQLVKLLLLASW